MIDRQGIGIHYCVMCQGIWFERDELNKIISKAKSEKSQVEYQRSNQDDHRHHD
jgi:uncharacterized protein